ncbi:unnamed protein product [Plutella xylostella]|uniref:(diamondback moth) hypothetical protein n=1 Tax=Plutella xylostella TaxID=51655 RepID=A0A8S4EKS1_PLUXY|nr:unnamed protein product [Plutella xylostella]
MSTRSEAYAVELVICYKFRRFDIVRKLGQGTYGKVQLGINKKTGQEVAIKTIKKCKIESEADLVRIRREVQIMSSVRHPNIVHIYEVFENSEKMILVMEYCSGGELYDYLSQKKVLQEDEARRLFRQIATAVYYCHIHKICHRDLKLENVLLDETGSAKIADFGLSNVFKETALLATFCGSPLYASPEIVKGTPYIGPEVDCWSLGVLLYTLVYGAMPFDGSNFKRLVRQISNGDYYEPKNPSSASPLIRDMLTVDPLKRADIVYICDHPWVNTGCSTSCLEVSEALAAETPVRLDLLLSLAPPAASSVCVPSEVSTCRPSWVNTGCSASCLEVSEALAAETPVRLDLLLSLAPPAASSVCVPSETELGAAESATDLTLSMAVEPSNSAEKRILDLVAEGGEDAIKPSPTRTLVSAGDNKRKLELAASAAELTRKKERVASSARIPTSATVDVLSEESLEPPPPPSVPPPDLTPPPTEGPDLVQPTLKSSATITINPGASKTPEEELPLPPKELPKEEVKEKPATVKPKVTMKKKLTKAASEEKPPTEKLDEPKEEVKPSSVAAAADKLTSLTLAQPAPAQPAPKPKKFSIPGGSVGSFKEQFERRASLTSPEAKRTVTKPVVSKIAKPKAQSEDRELQTKTPEGGSVRLQQIGIEPSPAPQDCMISGGVKKTESEPAHSSAADPSALLQDARRSLQNSMAKLVEEKAGQEDTRRRAAARDIITSAIRKPPVPYGRSSSAGVTSLASPPATPAAAPRVYRTEAQHSVNDHRNNSRGTSVERIIPIQVSPESPTAAAPPPRPAPAPAAAAPRANQVPLRRLISSESGASEASSSPSGEPIKKSAREFIIPIAVEGKGYVTPRQGSLEPESSSNLSGLRHTRVGKPRRISSLVSGGESEEEDESHMHRLRSSRAARAESVSSGEEDEEDEGFHLLTAENLFSTLLHRVRALTNRLNGEEGPGFPQHPHSLFNNLQSPFFNSSHLSRRHNALREGWGSRDMHADFDSMFNKTRQNFPRGSSKKCSKQSQVEGEGEGGGEGALDLSDLDLSAIRFSERELEALSGLTPALSRRLQTQLLAHLPPAAARRLRRALSLQPVRAPPPPPAVCTLPRRRAASREVTPTADQDKPTKESSQSRGSSIRSTPDRSLLSKYLTPERTFSLDESYSSDNGSILSEPSYIAAYGAPSGPGLASRRHSMRASNTSTSTEQPKKRISRFLRPDFFDTPPDESQYARLKKEKELETQKILKEIREKKNKTLNTPPPTGSSSVDSSESPTPKDDGGYARKNLNSNNLLTAKERSRSNTPFFPILDKIKETTLDTRNIETNSVDKYNESKRKTSVDESSTNNKESKLSRPKSYPVKNIDSPERTQKETSENDTLRKENKDKSSVQKDSKIARPKSYPTSSPSPEKVYISRVKKEEITSNDVKCEKAEVVKPSITRRDSDVEVSFNISLPKKPKPVPQKAHSVEICESNNQTNEVLVLKKYQVVGNNVDNTEKQIDVKEKEEMQGNGTVMTNGGPKLDVAKSNYEDEAKVKVMNHDSKKEEVKLKSTDSESSEKKVVKKKVVKKVSSKSKTDATSSQESDAKPTVEKKKVTKKIKEKGSEDAKTTTATKKKSVLQSIGQKLEKLTSNKSSSPDKEKVIDSKEAAAADGKKLNGKVSRSQREQSEPTHAEPTTESTLIKRAVTLTDVAALDSPVTVPNKTTVSKVLGLFKKFEPKEKVPKVLVDKHPTENLDSIESNNVSDCEGSDKPKRPTSLLLNGLGRKNKYGRTSSDSVPALANDDPDLVKKDSTKRNSLKLDFSRLPRVKKIVPTNPVIEPQIVYSIDNTEAKDAEKNGIARDADHIVAEPRARSRSRSRSTYSDSKTDLGSNSKVSHIPTSPTEFQPHLPYRELEPTTPEREDVEERIRRKSFYSRFNEKKQRRKSTLVGPGAAEYDPVARLHDPAPRDLSPLSPVDISPAADHRYRSFISELPVSPRNALRFDHYGLSDKVDNYRSLDRHELRKYPRSYLDYDQPASYGAHRYARTMSLLDSDPTEDHSLTLRDPHKYNRTISMYSPGNYATYRPNRTTRNSAIILKESEKEPSPENILEKIKNRKTISISVTRKKTPENETVDRSPVSSKGEGDGAECSEKVD